MERRGADKYPAAFVQKTYKDLEAAGKADLDATDGAGFSAAAAAAAASGSKDTGGGNLAEEGSDITGGAKPADGPKASGGAAKKTARAKKTGGAMTITEANENENVVVKEEETGDVGGDDDA